KLFPVIICLRAKQVIHYLAPAFPGLWKEAARRARITKDIHPQTLRHSYATHLLEQGVNILIIKELLGHAYIQSTMVYFAAKLSMTFFF
ncbi:MAG: tyrosine-type recombinase/integrase, partial [Chitinophagaceae bacterium]